MTWLERLNALARRHPVVILRVDPERFDALLSSRRGVGDFTIAFPHDALRGVHVPAPCIVLNRKGSDSKAYFGLLTSKGPVTTLETRVKFSRGAAISFGTAKGLSKVLRDKRQAASMTRRLRSAGAAIRLSPNLGAKLIDGLASILKNRRPMRAVAEFLGAPDSYSGVAAMQEDAVHTALAAFGLAADARSVHVDVAEGSETALARVPLIEDAVIEHDARTVPGFSFVKSDVTGRAIFRRGAEQLEVLTANRRALEHCFGVDLIYVNLTKQNVVMLQYKMLEPTKPRSGDVDWVYRPDPQLSAELQRMKLFDKQLKPGKFEYRLNCTTFYFKFVKRDAAASTPSVITPLDHFETLLADPTMRGPRQGLRVSFRSLDGRYLRQSAFIDLLQFGYIGSYTATTAKLRTLIEAVLAGDRSVFAAVQSQVARP
jgi:hypothetical protein